MKSRKPPQRALVHVFFIENTKGQKPLPEVAEEPATETEAGVAGSFAAGFLNMSSLSSCNGQNKTSKRFVFVDFVWISFQSSSYLRCRECRDVQHCPKAYRFAFIIVLLPWTCFVDCSVPLDSKALASKNFKLLWVSFSCF